MDSQILFSDYSDPDVCKSKDGGYWLTASSFQCAPGLPILYSENLTDWQLVNYAIDSVPLPPALPTLLLLGQWGSVEKYWGE